MQCVLVTVRESDLLFLRAGEDFYLLKRVEYGADPIRTALSVSRFPAPTPSIAVSDGATRVMGASGVAAEWLRTAPPEVRAGVMLVGTNLPSLLRVLYPAGFDDDDVACVEAAARGEWPHSPPLRRDARLVADAADSVFGFLSAARARRQVCGQLKRKEAMRDREEIDEFMHLDVDAKRWRAALEAVASCRAREHHLEVVAEHSFAEGACLVDRVKGFVLVDTDQLGPVYRDVAAIDGLKGAAVLLNPRTAWYGLLPTVPLSSANVGLRVRSLDAHIACVELYARTAIRVGDVLLLAAVTRDASGA